MMKNIITIMFVVALVMHISSGCFVKLSNTSNFKKIENIITCDTSLVNYLDKHWYPNRGNDCHASYYWTFLKKGGKSPIFVFSHDIRIYAFPALAQI
jgi:hypothetical protein